MNNSVSDSNHRNEPKVGNYILKKSLGKGNFATVKLAVHMQTGAKVAVKIIDKNKLKQKDNQEYDNLKKIKREIEIMKKIDHPNILKLYEVFEDKNNLFLITDVCENGELFEHLVSNGRLKENEARKLFKQVLDAVEYLHNCGIVHRDLKAENLLLRDNKTIIKVADFGFSNYFQPGDLLNTYCGSLPYASPELFLGRKYNGQKTDIWSLGVILYALVCGALPFGKESIRDLKTSILNCTYRIPFWLSRECEDLIRSMLVLEPEKRFSIQQIRAHKWMKLHFEDNQLDSNEINDTIGNLDKLKLNTGNFNNSNSSLNDDDQLLYDEVADLARKFGLRDIDKFMSSVKDREFDELYALYHLHKDYGCYPQSNNPSNLSPKLPVVDASSHRKSSITTGIVERDNSDQAINPSLLTNNLLNTTLSTQRRHTFGPEYSSTTNLNANAKPVFSITPPNTTQEVLLSNLDQTNIAMCSSNLPLQGNRLKQPGVFLQVTNNMLRRASDGQANYSQSNDNHLNPNHNLDENVPINEFGSELDERNNNFNNNGNACYGSFECYQNPHPGVYASTPSPPANYNNQMSLPYFDQQSPNNTHMFTAYRSNVVNQLLPNNIPYSSNQLDLKDKNNYLSRKRHSLQDSLETGVGRRKMHNSSGNSSQILTNQPQQLNINNNFNNNLLQTSKQFLNQACLPIYKDPGRRRASEGSGQLLTQLNPTTIKRLEGLSSGGDILFNEQLAQNKNIYNSNLDSNVLNLLSSPSLNQLKLNQQQNLNNINKPTNSNIQKVQLGLHSLCVSSPPSLQTSPTHHQQTLNNHHLQQNQQTQLTYQKSQSPPVQSLQIISEEQPTNLMYGNDQQIKLINKNNLIDNSNTNSPTQFANYPITPPQSFRTPSLNDQQPQFQSNNLNDMSSLSEHLQKEIRYIQQQQFKSTPSISVTNEMGFIIPAPKPFEMDSNYFNNQLNHLNQLNQLNHINQMNERMINQSNDFDGFNNLNDDGYLVMGDETQISYSPVNSVWKQEDNKLTKTTKKPIDETRHYNWYNKKQEDYCMIGSLIKQSSENVLQQVHHINRSEEDEPFEQFDETDEEVQNLLQLSSPDNGSMGIILINDTEAAKKLLLKFQQNDSILNDHPLLDDQGDQRLLFEENNICIEAQYNKLKQRLVLRRVSGEMDSYTALCQQLINNVS